MVTSDLKAEMEIRPFRACAMKYMSYGAPWESWALGTCLLCLYYGPLLISFTQLIRAKFRFIAAYIILLAYLLM